MKYKIGDKVRIKSIDWYNENKDNYDCVYAGNGFGFWKNMVRHCGEIMKITTVKVDPEDSNKGFYFMENSDKKWTDEMIEGLVEEETKPNITEEAKTYWDNIKDAWICPEGYIFKDENGNVINATKIVLEKKKKEYPKTYEECLKILGFTTVYTPKVEPMFDYDDDIIALQKLKNCRNAYWKIAGEEMGLGKSWEPDWNTNDNHFYTIHTFNGKIECSATAHRNAVLIFPTEEMRDAFYENFKEIIESCKELL